MLILWMKIQLVCDYKKFDVANNNLLSGLLAVDCGWQIGTGGKVDKSARCRKEANILTEIRV